MLSFYFISLGVYLFYTRSKYFPADIFRPSFAGSKILGFILILTGSLLFVRSDNWAGGLLLALAAASSGMALIQLFAVLGKNYFYGLAAFIHGLLLIELLSYAR